MITDNPEQTTIRDALLRTVQAIPSINLKSGAKVTIELSAEGIKLTVDSEPSEVTASAERCVCPEGPAQMLGCVICTQCGKP